MSKRAPRDTILTCPCGYRTPRTTAGLATYGLRVHDCDRHRRIGERKARGEAIRARNEANRDPKPCPHGGRHVHGSHAAYVLDQCRCRPCTDSNTTYERRRIRQNAYGRPAYIDAAPARQHVLDLRAQGLGAKKIATLAGVSHGALAKLVYGDATRNLAPSKRIRPETAAKILAVTVTLDNLGQTVSVDGTGTHRRLQALVWLGWSQSKLAERLGTLPGNFSSMLQRDRVHAETARKVRALYDEMKRTRPPETTWHERSSASRARNHARANGWKPPMWWGDDIDDPHAIDEPVDTEPGIDDVAVERAMRGEPVEISKDERLEVVRRLAAAGVNKTEIARRLRLSSQTINALLEKVA